MRQRIIHLIAAARPNFMKIAPLYHALNRDSELSPVIIHTGQHYDINMSDVFFQDLDMPAPDIHLGVGSGTHAQMTAQVMTAYEEVLDTNKPDLIIVVGDVNSTMAVTLTASKLGLPIAHLEAGLRSYDRSMPEEINRVVTDSLAEILWTPSPDADENLAKEGIPSSKVHRVGNIMIDSLERLRPRIENELIYQKFGFERHAYGVVTIHRPVNVDDPAVLEKVCAVLKRVSAKIPLVFPVHPRTSKNIQKHGFWEALLNAPGLTLIDPLSYIQFMNLVFNCRLVLTDSGGIQEETTYVGIPCLTLRENTERPITVAQGTNRLCSWENVEQYVDDILGSESHTPHAAPDLWDGSTSSRVLQSLREFFARSERGTTG